ncbi:MAG TPA: helix-turn-helix domain-containing protein [Candidatus Baltobacterales bacterium]|nr:helix-turn-helix domain-containing protein [Candidatus Baltobacterales bacterium]
MTSTTPSSSPWLSLGEASRLLGITPATLRRWADHGDVAAFVTPGGHRRFARAAIEALVPRSSARRPLTGLGDSATRVARMYRRSSPAARPAATGGSLSEAERAEFKDRGRRLLMLLLDHVADEKRPRSGAKLAEAVAAASDYGRRAASLGASLSETVEAFVRFRGAFTGELAAVARRRRLDAQAATALLVEADGAVDRLLVALMNGHSERAS